MAEQDWQEAYERTLTEALREGRAQVQPSPTERRVHPRFEISGAEVLVERPVAHGVADISISGMAFYSDEPFPAGKRISLSLRGILAMQATVMGSDSLADEPDAPAPYKIRCRFESEDSGMRFLLMAIQIEQGE